MNELSLINFHDVKLYCQPATTDGSVRTKKHLHAFLIDLSSLKARKSLCASDHPSLETRNNVGATLKMLMMLADEDSVMVVNKTHRLQQKGGNRDWVCQ